MNFWSSEQKSNGLWKMIFFTGRKDPISKLVFSVHMYLRENILCKHWGKVWVGSSSSLPCVELSMKEKKYFGLL